MHKHPWSLAATLPLLVFAMMLMLGGRSVAQGNYSFDFEADSTGWTGNFVRFSGPSSCGGAGWGMRRNLYFADPTGELISPPINNPAGAACTVTFDYKVALWRANVIAAPAPWGSIDLQYGSSPTGPWTSVGTVSEEPQTGACIPKAFSFTPSPGVLYFRWNCTLTGGNNFWSFDNITITFLEGLPCLTPAPGNTVGPAYGCPGTAVTVSLQNPTSGLVVSYQWYESTVSAAGPWSPVGLDLPTHTTAQAVDTWYYCEVTCSEDPTTVASTPLAVPMSTPNFPQDWSSGVVDPNCWSVQALLGTARPTYSPVSGFQSGTGSVKWDFWSFSANQEMALTSPTFDPVTDDLVVVFDVAGSMYNANVDQIVLEQSSDGGGTWTPITTMDNGPTGELMTTGSQILNFVPTIAGHWRTLTYALSTGTNRLRFRGISAFGNSVYLDNVQVTEQPAYHSSLGTGCHDVYRSSLVQLLPDAPAAKVALEGNSLVFVNTGDGYVAFWEPGAASSYFRVPGIGAASLTFVGTDDGHTTITPSLAAPIPGGFATDWTVSVNGILTAGPVANNPNDYTPTLADVGAAQGLAFYSWSDWNTTNATSGPIQVEEVGDQLYVTWNDVEAPQGDRCTFQFQVDLAAGHVRISWVAHAPATATRSVLVGATLAGTGSAPPSSVLATATPFVVAQDLAAMSLTASGAPIHNGPAVTYAIENLPESFPGSGMHQSAVVFGFAAIPGGYSLGVPPFDFGAPGCNGYLATFDHIVLLAPSTTPSASFQIAWNIPGKPAQLWMQAVGLFHPRSLPIGLSPGGIATSNALEIYVAEF